MTDARSEVDLAVVGGGPAGLATAIRARQQGLTVVVFEAGQPPVDRACGEGLMPDGAARLTELGVQLPDNGSAEFHGIRWSDGHYEAEGRFPGSPGRGIRRLVLHRALAERAAELGAELRWGVRVSGVEEHTVFTAGEMLRARVVVGADGRASRVRRWFGLEGPRATRRRFGLRRHFELVPWSDFVEVHWHDDAEAYVTPVGPNQVGVAILSDHKDAEYDEYLKLFPTLEARLQGVSHCSRLRGAGPLEQRARGVVTEHGALVGDAAGYLDAITGEGLSLAFHQAFALVQAIVVGDLSAYAAAHRRIGRAPLALTRLVLFMGQRPRLRRRVVRALARDRELFDQFLALHVGEASSVRVGFGSGIRLVAGLLRS